MSKVYDFIKECGIFYVLTVSGNAPVGRPFGAIMEHNDKLYITTADTKQVYNQIKGNPNIQILALKSGTGNWIRVSGIAVETTDLSLKQMMLDECPVLSKHYASSDAPHYVLLEVTVTHAELN